MKKLFSILLFMGMMSCSVQDQGFLDQVKGKSIYEDGTKYHTFSSDGKTIDMGEEGTPTFIESISERKGIYKSQIDGDDNFLGIDYGGETSIMYISNDKSELFTDKIHPGDKTDISIK